MRKLISSGSSFEAQIGYSRAVVDDDFIFVSGTTGFNYKTMTISDDIVVQTEQALHNVSAALHEAGATLADIVRVTYIVPDATMFSAGLADPRMKIEIEVTARKTARI